MERISELSSAIVFLRLKNAIALLSSEMSSRQGKPPFDPSRVICSSEYIYSYPIKHAVNTPAGSGSCVTILQFGDANLAILLRASQLPRPSSNYSCFVPVTDTVGELQRTYHRDSSMLTMASC